MTNVLHIFSKQVFRQSLALRKCFFLVENCRPLYSAAGLGIDKFLQTREMARKQLVNISDKFKDRMKQFVTENSNTMIFTEDLKNMIHLAENDEDIELIIKMMKKFNQQNNELRFGNFIFGPVVMRLFHVLNKPEQAIQCFRAPELHNFFDQLMSYQVLFDLLYENEKHSEILQLFKEIQEKQLQGIKFPKNVVVLVMAACYKMNTTESYEFAKKLWKELHEVGHQPMRRAVTFFAGLCLKQKQPEQALEVVSSYKNQNYTTIRNIKVSAFCELERFEDCITVLKIVLNVDEPSGTAKIQTFNKDIIQNLKEKIEKSGSEELKTEMEKVEKYLREEEHISELTLNEQLCSEITAPINLDKRQDRYGYHPQSGAFRQPRVQRSVGGLSRPGLSDIA